MFAVVKTYKTGANYGRVIQKFSCRYKALEFIDETNCDDLVICILVKNVREIRNFKPDNYLKSYMTTDRNPDLNQAVLLFKYT